MPRDLREGRPGRQENGEQGALYRTEANEAANRRSITGTSKVTAPKRRTGRMGLVQLATGLLREAPNHPKRTQTHTTVGWQTTHARRVHNTGRYRRQFW